MVRIIEFIDKIKDYEEFRVFSDRRRSYKEVVEQP